MIGRFQNRSDWNDASFQARSQSQFNYHDRIPHYGWDFHYAGGMYLPHQASGPTIPAVAPLHQPQPAAYCEICQVKVGNYKNLEMHNNGKKHQRMLELNEELPRLKTSNEQIPNSQMNLVHPKTVLKSGKNGCPVKDISSDVTTAKHKNYIKKHVGVTSEVPAGGPEGKPRDNTGGQGHHSFKHEIGGAKKVKYIKTNDGVRRPVESSKLDINVLSNSVESPVIPPLPPPPLVASGIMAPTPAVGSSFKLPYQHVSASQTQVLEGRESHKFQNPTVEINNQPQVPADSNINAQTEDLSSISAAIATGLPKGHMTSQVFTSPPLVAYCKICEVRLPSYKNVEMHNNGKRHRRMLNLQTLKTSNGQIPNSQMNSLVQPKTVQKSGKNGQLVKNVSSEASISKHKKYLQKDIGVTSKVPAGGSEGKPRDNTVAHGHGFKYKTIRAKTGKSMKTNSGVGRPVESSKPDVKVLSNGVEPLVQIPALPSPSGPVLSQIIAPTPVLGSSFEPQFQYVSVSQTQVSKAKGHCEIHNHTAETNNRPHAPADSNINIQTKGVSSDSAAIAIVPPEGLMASQVFILPQSVGSSFEPQIQHVLQTQVLESRVHNEIQNPIMETNDQSQSISMELDTPVGSDIDSQTEDAHSDCAAIATRPPKGLTESHAFTRPPAVGSCFESQIQGVLQTDVSESKFHHENHTMETNDQPQSISVELHAPAGSDIDPQTADVSSDSAEIARGPEPQIEHVLQTEVSKSKVLHEIQNPVVEINGQPLSISMELDVPADSDIDSQTEDARSDSATIATGQPKGLMESHAFALPSAVGPCFEPQIQDVLQTEVSESKVHHEIQNPMVETNDQSQSISMELDDPAGSAIDSQTEDENYDSAAVAIGPASQVSAPPPALESSFEPQIQHFLLGETEPQLSKAITDCEGQNYAHEKNNQLLSSALVEYNAPSVSTANTQTADGSSEAEQKMDVLTNQSALTQLSQVAVCLTCGDKGFPEALVFCNKCQVYALHRYCLDGPVIFTDDVTWFCEDCEPKVADSSSHDQCALLPSGKGDSLKLAKDASPARIEPKNCIKRVKKNKQKQRNIAAKTKVLLSDSHSLSQCSNICEKEKKFGKECQPVSRDEDNTSEGSVIIAVPQPILDPIWRGSLCIRPNQSLGLLAHLSTLACSNVLEETRLFPEVLSVDLLQRSAVWPKSFVKCRPNEDSIALYFFPENERVEGAFDKLVDDMISLDLAIRTMIENAELLVFPSTLLPIEYRRFQAKYYLWGVFRTMKTSPNTKDAAGGEDTSGLTSP